MHCLKFFPISSSTDRLDPLKFVEEQPRKTSLHHLIIFNEHFRSLNFKVSFHFVRPRRMDSLLQFFYLEPLDGPSLRTTTTTSLFLLLLDPLYPLKNVHLEGTRVRGRWGFLSRVLSLSFSKPFLEAVGLVLLIVVITSGVRWLVGWFLSGTHSR